MNCANHPEVAVAAYCQTCGKPLCPACLRSVGGVIYCEPCLAARLASPPAASATPDLTGLHAHPLLAGLLGFIPGVGAMYNGQFAKALAHVLIFAVFVSLSDRSLVFGLLVAAWIFYQVFDAAQTAKARRDGLPLPNPFGLNDLGSKLGMPPTLAGAPYMAGFSAAGPAAADPGQNPAAGPATAASGGAGWTPVPPPPGYPASYTTPPAAPGSTPPVYGGTLPVTPAKQLPLGAIVLIGIGAVLLLHTLGIFEDEWISRSWPLILIGAGIWLFYRRTQGGS